MKFRTSMLRFRDNETPQPKKCEPVQDYGITSEQASEARANGEFVQEDGAAERFARASDSMHGYRSAPSAEELKGLTPEQRFARASADRHRLNPRFQEEARRRRRD
jgi:hypothetical protein